MYILKVQRNYVIIQHFKLSEIRASKSPIQQSLLTLQEANLLFNHNQSLLMKSISLFKFTFKYSKNKKLEKPPPTQMRPLHLTWINKKSKITSEN